MARGERALLVAEDEHGAIIGTAQVVWAHRRISRIAPTSPRCWCIGARGGWAWARRYSRPPKHAARDAGKTLLVLDTASAEAERLYERGGWQRVGTIPNFALWPDGGPCDTVVYYKRLD